MTRKLRTALTIVSDIGALGFDLQHHSDEAVAEAVKILRTVNPEMFDYLSRVLSVGASQPHSPEMHTWKRTFVVCLFALLAAVPASAQNPVNPTQVSFDYDPTDFTNIDGFELGYFSSANSTQPVQISSLVATSIGCAVNGAVESCTEALVSRPNQFQTWFVGVRAAANTVRSPWSAPLVPFDRAPSAPTNVRPK